MFLLNAVSFQYIKPNKEIIDASYDKIRYGYIAQDVEKIYPDLVMTDTKGYKAVNYNAFIPMILNTNSSTRIPIRLFHLKHKLLRVRTRWSIRSSRENIRVILVICILLVLSKRPH